MKQRLYALKNYTESGDLSPPPILLYVLLFLLRTWVILVCSVLSHETGNQIMRMFYPDKTHFYLGLALGIVPLIVFFISGRRHAQKKWAYRLWPYCLYLIIIGIAGDLVAQLYYLSLEHFQYSVAASIQLVIIAWSCLFILKSQQLKDSFKQNY